MVLITQPSYKIASTNPSTPPSSIPSLPRHPQIRRHLPSLPLLSPPRTSNFPHQSRLQLVARSRGVADIHRLLHPRSLSVLMGGNVHADKSPSRDTLLVSPALLSITTPMPLRRPAQDPAMARLGLAA
ncbi:unnamed protein product [Urochloa humidicola]